MPRGKTKSKITSNPDARYPRARELIRRERLARIDAKLLEEATVGKESIVGGYRPDFTTIARTNELTALRAKVPGIPKVVIKDRSYYELLKLVYLYGTSYALPLRILAWLHAPNSQSWISAEGYTADHFYPGVGAERAIVKKVATLHKEGLIRPLGRTAIVKLTSAGVARAVLSVGNDQHAALRMAVGGLVAKINHANKANGYDVT